MVLPRRAQAQDSEPEPELGVLSDLSDAPEAVESPLPSAPQYRPSDPRSYNEPKVRRVLPGIKTITKGLHQEGVENIVRIAQTATPAERDYWSRWYYQAQEAAQDMASMYDLPLATVAGVIAVLSPGNFWDSNLASAHRLIQWWLRDKATLDYVPDRFEPKGPYENPAAELPEYVVRRVFKRQSQADDSWEEHRKRLWKTKVPPGKYILHNEEEPEPRTRPPELPTQRKRLLKDLAYDQSLRWVSDKEKKRKEFVPPRDMTAEQFAQAYAEARAQAKETWIAKELENAQERQKKGQGAKNSKAPTLDVLKARSPEDWERAFDAWIQRPDTSDPLERRAPRVSTNNANNVVKGIKILETNDPWSYVRGPKVSVFFESILDPQMTENKVVLDGHAINLYRGHKRKLEGVKATRKELEAMREAYAQAAEYLGMTSQGLQALTWYLWKTGRLE